MSFSRNRFAIRQALTISELLVSIGAIAIFLALILPALYRGQGANKRIVCQSNLRQLALAATNYHSAQLHFPACTGMGDVSKIGSIDQMSLIVQVLPFIDDEIRQRQISERWTFDGKKFPAYPPLSAAGYEPWKKEVPILLCPNVPEFETGFAKTHFGFCIGDRARNIASPKSSRGAFAGSLTVSYEDIGDGASNTIMLAEIGARSEASCENRWAINRPSKILDDPSLCFDLVTQNENWTWFQGVQLSSSGRGAHWADGRAGVSLFSTILPPNSPSASVGRGNSDDGIYSASSPHLGGINVARVDGSVTFLDEEIDAGDPASPTLTEDQMADGEPSPYGVWGALGTINGGDVADEF